MRDTRFIGGAPGHRGRAPYDPEVRVHIRKNGQTEASGMAVEGWTECPQPATERAAIEADMALGHVWRDGDWVPMPEQPLTPQELLDKLARNKERSSRRATTKVRRLCKHKGLTVMLTLTYRENMLDRSRMARDFDVFMKRLRRIVPGIEYVCVFEQQKRGAWHAHIAVPRVLAHYMHKGQLVRSYDLLRSLWRGVVGADNGNVDVSRNKRVGRSSARLANYISKYISKSFMECASGGRDSYSASGRALPGAVSLRALSGELSVCINQLLDLVQVEVNSAVEFKGALLDCGGFFLSLSP